MRPDLSWLGQLLCARVGRRLKAMGNPKYQVDGDPETSGPGFGSQFTETSSTAPSMVGPADNLRELNERPFPPRGPRCVYSDVFEVMRRHPAHTYQVLTKRSKRLPPSPRSSDWPDNVWMGVSVENARYRFRASHLRQTPAKTRFLSVEPLIGPVGELDLNGIDWVIVGGESGHRSRPGRARLGGRRPRPVH